MGIARKLGKLAPKVDPRTLRLADYLTAELPPAPDTADWGKAVPPPWGMMRNDEIGNCTIVAAAHATQVWTANATLDEPTYTMPDADIVAAYSEITGYEPGDPMTDGGAIELTVLKHWRKVGIGGRKLGAFAAIELQNKEDVRAALWLFGGLYIGIALPESAKTQSVWSVPWHYPVGTAQPGSWGGHAVVVVGYDTRGLTCITWGQPQRMTWGFWAKFCDEAYALLSSDWVTAEAAAPSGFDLASLQNDLISVTR